MPCKSSKSNIARNWHQKPPYGWLKWLIFLECLNVESLLALSLLKVIRPGVHFKDPLKYKHFFFQSCILAVAARVLATMVTPWPLKSVDVTCESKLGCPPESPHPPSQHPQGCCRYPWNLSLGYRIVEGLFIGGQLHAARPSLMEPLAGNFADVVVVQPAMRLMLCCSKQDLVQHYRFCFR